MKPKGIILEGIVGSTAYGLDTENSDIDIKGIYMLPLEKILEVNFNQNKTTKVHTDPDWSYHEIGKYMSLVASGNPSLIELLFLDKYTSYTDVGNLLIQNRNLFLSKKAIMNAYRGYAFQQVRKLSTRTSQGLDGYDSSLKNRFEKHTRHCFRLLMQARQLLETGDLDVKVTSEQREYLFAMGKKPVNEIVDEFMRQDKEFDSINSVLPDRVDIEKINRLLYEIRINYEV